METSLLQFSRHYKKPSFFYIHFQTFSRHSRVRLFYFLPAISKQHQIINLHKFFHTSFSYIYRNFIHYHRKQKKAMNRTLVDSYFYLNSFDRLPSIFTDLIFLYISVMVKTSLFITLFFHKSPPNRLSCATIKLFFQMYKKKHI